MSIWILLGNKEVVRADHEGIVLKNAPDVIGISRDLA
jgi:hypothetical protein